MWPNSVNAFPLYGYGVLPCSASRIGNQPLLPSTGQKSNFSKWEFPGCGEALECCKAMTQNNRSDGPFYLSFQACAYQHVEPVIQTVRWLQSIYFHSKHSYWWAPCCWHLHTWDESETVNSSLAYAVFHENKKKAAFNKRWKTQWLMYVMLLIKYRFS